MSQGDELYFAQSDSRSSGQVVYRMRVLERRPERLVVSVDNVTPVRLFLLTLFAPGDLQSTFFLERLSEPVPGAIMAFGDFERTH